MNQSDVLAEAMRLADEYARLSLLEDGMQQRAAIEAFLRANLQPSAALSQALEALQDITAGWRYIRSMHGDLYGVGWDRAQDKADAAMAAIEASLPPAAPAPTDAELEAKTGEPHINGWPLYSGLPTAQEMPQTVTSGADLAYGRLCRSESAQEMPPLEIILDDEITDIWAAVSPVDGADMDIYEFARAIEAKVIAALREKGGV